MCEASLPLLTFNKTLKKKQRIFSCTHNKILPPSLCLVSLDIKDNFFIYPVKQDFKPILHNISDTYKENSYSEKFIQPQWNTQNWTLIYLKLKSCNSH